MMKDIKGYEGLYAVTEDGFIWSHRRQKYLRDWDNNGYRQVVLHKDSKPKAFSVHRLVAEAFIDNPYGLPEINHRDENKTNNHVENLEWCTRHYNLKYGTAALRSIAGHKKPVYCVELDKVYPSINAAYRATGARNITLCIKGKVATSGGYHWRYAEKN